MRCQRDKALARKERNLFDYVAFRTADGLKKYKEGYKGIFFLVSQKRKHRHKNNKRSQVSEEKWSSESRKKSQKGL